MTTRWSSPKCKIYTVIVVVALIILTLIVTLMHTGSVHGGQPKPHLGTALVGGEGGGSGGEVQSVGGSDGGDVTGSGSDTGGGGRTSGTRSGEGDDGSEDSTEEGGAVTGGDRIADSDSNSIGRPLDGTGNPVTNLATNGKPMATLGEIPKLHDPEKAEIEFIKPKKILGKPLHATDVLYEGKIIDTDGTGGQHAPKSHWTGLFRNKTSRIWDPNPEYDIEAFGLTMRINLFHDRGVMADGLKETHVWPNKTLRKQENSEDAGGQGCYYKGHVENDEKSLVVVSLCDGIKGHIRTSNGSFFIEPREQYTNEGTNIWHAFWRERGPTRDETNTVDEHGSPVGSAKDDGGNCALDTKQEEQHKQQLEPHHSRTKRSTAHINNNEYTIEVLVAVDRKMREYHGDTLKSYVLTLMSIVSSIYADASIGNSIKIAVSHILYIEEDLADKHKLDQNGSKGVSASDMLQGFCHLKRRANFHHDTAFLLTREQICRHQSKCDTLGLAELGTMCKPSSCAIVQDNGLSAAFTIAHELGHVLSMPHDDDVRCIPFRGEGIGKQNIMSRMLDQNTHPWSWSNCSRNFVTEYLEQNHASCMLDKPTTDLIEPSSSHTKLAGEKFTNNQQCELVFGNGSRICSYMPVCERLWCNNGDELLGCRTQHMPWADGTSCGENQWCQKGQCVHVNRKALQPQDGGWGQWSPFSECSRSCGTGVQISTRVCDSPLPANGGKYCIGMRMQYRSCNTHECPNSTLDYREEQCQELDGNNFDIPGLEKNVKWVPKYGVKTEDQCKLYCRVKNSNNYFLLRDKVKDGTPCVHPHESYDMCINGHCRKAGCDYVFDSDAKLDKCGVCRGNNDTCSDVNGVFPHSNIHYMKKPFGYVQKIVRIPRGATNIVLIQRGYKDDGNYLALRDENQEYIFNPPKIPIIPGFKKRLFAGVMLEYNGPDEPIETIQSDFGRPLKRDLIVEIYSHNKMRPVSENIVEYSFTIPIDRPQPQQQQVQPVAKSTPAVYVPQYISQNSIPNYQWKMSDWSECDRSCYGRKHRTARCYDIETGEVKNPSFCRNSAKPREDYEACNTECKFEWEPLSSECSNSCGEGTKYIKYQCIQRFLKTQITNSVDSTFCSNIQKPRTEEKCYGTCPDATWIYGDWDQCSATCNGGQQKRTIACLSAPNGLPISESFCAKLPREETIRVCNTDSCPEWVTGELTPCSVTCGEGQQRYAIHCVLNNVSVNAALCGTRPVAVLVNCTMPPCEKKQESTYAYSGEETRPSVIRHHDMNHFYSASHTDISYSNSSSSKQQQQPTLQAAGHHPYKWCKGVWSTCNAKCNGGTRWREVRCCHADNESATVSDLYCHHEKKPLEKTNCGNFRCPQWNFGQWGECNDDCKRYRQVLCQDHRGKESNECPLNQKPPEVESCCHFRWRITNWKPCNVTCGGGDGYRTGERVCMRLFPKSVDNPHPVKTGRKVDAKHCAHVKIPPAKKLVRKCKPCQFRWEVSPWSKCSVGCGVGLATRNVTCSNGRTTAAASVCDAKHKPSNVKPCETYTSCRWSTGRWNRCKCDGFQRRSVKCYDEITKTESIRCPETRPYQKRKCEPAPDCRQRYSKSVAFTCADVQRIRRTRADGEYTLSVQGRPVSVYCHNMTSNAPTEYVTLKSGLVENYAIYINRRAANAGVCAPSSADWVDESISYGATHYRKIRINIGTLQVMEDDHRFTDRSGQPQAFGSAGDCYSNTGSCPQGDFSINLEGTPFRIRPRTQWETKGQNAVIHFLIRLEAPYKKVRARCGGYCGTCSVSRSSGLFLELV